MAVFPVSASSHVRDNMILFSNGLVPESWVGQRNVHSAREAVRGDEEKIVTLFSQKQDVVGSVTGMMGKLGYVPSKELLVAVCLMSDTELSNFWGKLKDVMEWDSGAAREMGKHIVYKNFPAEVLAMSECKYWFLQFLRYLGLEPLAETFQEKEIPREELDEAFKGKVISIAAPNALDRITDDLLSKAKDWTDTDRAFVEQLIFKQGVQVDENMVAKVDFNMNLVWLLTLGFEYDVLKQDITLNNPADILRFGAFMGRCAKAKVTALDSGMVADRSDVSVLPTTLSRRQRRIILSMLEACSGDLEANAAEDISGWKGLMRSLRPRDYAFAVRSNALYKDIISGSLQSYTQKLESALAEKDKSVSLDLLSQRPGVFMRRLHHAYSLFGRDAFDAFLKVADKLSVGQILDISSYFAALEDWGQGTVSEVSKRAKDFVALANDNRVKEGEFKFRDLVTGVRIDEEGDNTLLYTTSYVAPGGQSAKAYPVFMVRKPILDEDLLAIKQGLDAVIGGRLRAAFPEGFNVDEKLRNVKFPTNGQTAFSEGSGTVIDIPENIQFLRSASYWKFGESRNIWFDNGWIFMEESGKFAGSCDWCTTHNTDFASFSGDPTIAGSPTNEACQLVDVRLNEVPGTVRYGLWSIRCYSDIPFSGAEDVFALLQWGEEPQKGSVLDPRRNVIKAPLTSDREPIVHLVMVDFHERKLIVVDQNFGGHVSGVSDMAGLVARRATSFARKAKRMPSMFDLLSLVPGSIPAVLSDEGLDIQGKALVINKRNDQNQIEDVRLAEVVDL